MNCPNCGTAEKARVKVCPECNQAYASQDLQELRQLEYLIAETATWQVETGIRSPYEERLHILLKQLTSHLPEQGVKEPELPVTLSTEPVTQTPHVVINNKTPVFSGPGTEYTILGQAAPGKAANLIHISRNQRWFMIKISKKFAPDGRGWVQTRDVSPHNALEVPVFQAPPAPEEMAPKPAAAKPEPAPPGPPKEKVPFDQWLLSERNIKIALYSGGLLLLIAGIIFIGVNWTRIPGPGKFAITLLVTGLMYLGGFLLFQRPAYRIGGVALLGVASGFFVLNFAVLQIYVLGPSGMADNVMWLIASPFCLLLYMLTAYWTKSDLFTYFSLAAVGSVIIAGLVVAGASELAFLLAFACLALVLLFLARGFQNTQMVDFTYQPLMIVSHILAPLTFLGALISLTLIRGFLISDTGNIWLTLPILGIGTIFYILNGLWSRKPVFTYLSLVTLGLTMMAVLLISGTAELIYLLTYALYSLIILFLARLTKSSAMEEFTYQPLMVVANILMPVTYLVTFLSILMSIGNPWFAAAILGVGTVFYLMIAYWSRNLIFTYASLGAIAGLVFAILFNLQVPLMAYPLVYAILALVCLVLGRTLQDTSIGEFTRFPLLSTSQVAMPMVVFLAAGGWISQELITVFPWLPLATLGIAVLFYIATDVLFNRLEARWAAAILFTITFGMVLFQLNFSSSAIGISFMVLALVYLGLGYGIERREDRKTGGWPLYATSYVMAGLVTILAIPNSGDLTKILFADVVLLVISAAIHRVYWWVYGAVWLFMLPVYLVISQYVTSLPYQGLLMGLLGLNYAAAGYVLGRRKLARGGPFLSAAVFLSLVTIGLTWTDPLIATLVLSTIAGLYLLAALWLNWSWLLFPILLLVNLTVLTINALMFGYQAPIDYALTISYASLGLILTMGALVLRRNNKDNWSWPLYLIGTINICGAYLVSLAFADWVTIGISTVLTILLLSLTWLERDFIVRIVKFPLLTYLGIGVLFVGYFFLLGLLGGEGVWDFTWPAFTAGLCALFVALAWLLRQETINEIYGVPLPRAGLWLMLIPLVGSLVLFITTLFGEENSIIVAITFGIAAVTYTSDAAVRRIFNQAYFGLGAFMVVIWAVLVALQVSEPQAYIIPLGLILLGVGWYERSRKGFTAYKILTYAGLILLLGTAFIQSIPSGAYPYAILLAVESLIAIGWGVRSHCRCYIQVAGIAFLDNAIVQLGPGFIYLPRWIQIGLTGAILLGGGMAALFKREQILDTRKRVSDEWRQWNP